MAFFFVPLVAMTAIFSFAVWVYLTHCVVVVIEETAAGNDEVIWPDDPLLDWIWQGGYLLWVIGVWIMPAVLIARLATRGLLGDWHFAGAELSGAEARWAVTMVVAGAVFWLLFPVSLLSTMSAESRWAVLHGPLFQRLARNAVSLGIFYLLSGALVGACVPLVILLGFGSGAWSLILPGIVLSGAVLLISRLLGRLANRARLTYVQPRQKPPRRRSNAGRDRPQVADHRDVEEEVPELPEPPPPRFVQPSELPGVQTPFEGEMVGYDVRFQDSPAEKPPPERHRKKKAAGVRPADLEIAPRPQAAERLAHEHAAAIEPDRVEMQRAESRRQMDRNTPMTSGIITFLFQKSISVQWAILALGITILGLMVRGLQFFWPT